MNNTSPVGLESLRHLTFILKMIFSSRPRVTALRVPQLPPVSFSDLCDDGGARVTLLVQAGKLRHRDAKELA